MRPQGHTAPAGELFCSLSMAGSLLHGRPCFCTGLRCGSSGRASAEFSILPPPRHPPAGKKGGTGALSTCIIPKCAPLVKKKEGRTAVLPPSYAPARRDIQGPRFSSGCTKGRSIGEMPCGGFYLPLAGRYKTPVFPPAAPNGAAYRVKCPAGGYLPPAGIYKAPFFLRLHQRAAYRVKCPAGGSISLSPGDTRPRFFCTTRASHRLKIPPGGRASIGVPLCSLMPGCAGWRPAPPPPAPDGSGSGPEWPPPAYGGLRG